LASFVPLLSYYILNNKTFEIDYEKKDGDIYDLKLQAIHINTVTGFTPNQLEMVPGTNNVHYKLGGIDADIELDGSLKALFFIPLDAAGVKITNMTLDLMIEQTPGPDGIKFVIKDQSKVTFGSIDVKMKSKFL